MKEQNPSNLNEKNYSQDEMVQLLFEKILVPKIESINGLFSNEFFKEYIEVFWSNRNAIYYDKKKYDNRLDNIATVANNKIIEVANYFKAHNMNFYDEARKTSLARMILEDLIFSYEAGAIFLIKSYDISQKAAEYYNDVMEFLTLLTKYQNITNNLWNYNVEKNVFASILNEYYEVEDKEKYKEKVDIYISQLETMGLKKQSKEVSEYFEKVFNKDDSQMSEKETSNVPKDNCEKDKKVKISKEQKLFDFYQNKISKIRHLKEKLNLKDKKIPNAGILLNNKIVEVIKLFEKNGKNFYDFTPLAKMVMGVLEEYYIQAYNALEKYLIDDYKKYCTKIFDFSIEKVIVPYFNDKNKKDQSDSFKEKYQNCEEEIISLGYTGKDEER